MPMNDYFKWSQMLQTKFSGFSLHESELLMRTNTAPTSNFRRTKQLLLSKVTSTEEFCKLTQKLNLWNGSTFLDESEEIPQIVYSSYLRSGNTFLRNYLEKISGIVTGST